MPDKKKKPDGRQPKPAKKNAMRSHSNSSKAQRQSLLAWLQTCGSIDTITARRELDILGVAPRIFELRHRYGHRIDRVWIDQPTDCGKLHRVALYVFCPEMEGV
ncbi:MAG: Helix-turn-helix domain-containing protein [Candidatus Nitrotoga sp. SPKER]|nr:MAG: Helix-turn-helix domain-containing protein [Candidatus Nitrotoga sp. SPKER]